MNNEDKEVLNIVNNKKNSQIVYEGTEMYTKALEKSMYGKKEPYREKKNKKRKQIANATVAIILTGTVALSSAISSLGTKHVIEKNNIVISETKETKKDLNKKIEQYEKKMNAYGKETDRIEIITGRDYNGKAYVDYNTTNLTNHIQTASQISESETRTVILAAYNIINAPYRDKILSQAFDSVEKENLTGYTKELLESNFKNYIEKLGYSSIEEYNNNERENIKRLMEVEQYIGGINR